MQFKENLSINDSASSNPSAYPKVASWKVNGSEGRSEYCCLWDGVKCNSRHQVIGLDLSSSFLYGHINSNTSLFNLIHLRRLNLADNDFCFSQIPSRIGRLSMLTNLNLSISNFSGYVPKEISQLNHLVLLDLYGNYFSGRIPSLATRSRLGYLDLSYNEFDGRNLSVWVGKLPNLLYLNLGYNNLSCEIPSSIGNQTKLKQLYLDDNHMYGQIPSSLMNLTQLTHLFLGENEFIGSLPSLETLSNLEVMSLGYNNFDRWKLPDWFGKLNKLISLSLYDVNMYGEIPLLISNLTNLKRFSLDDNKLQGPIPSSFSNLINVETIFLGYNNISGMVELDNFLPLKKLQNLHLGGNKITLSAVSNNTIENLPKFKSLDLSSCDLRAFPDFLRFQNQLETLNLADNKIDGRIPEWMGNISKETLRQLDLSRNSLTGFENHPAIVPWVGLQILTLRNNMLQGLIPMPPPTTLSFVISNNNLIGEIPPSICDLRSLSFLDLSFNNITGNIPPCLDKLSNSLKILNLRGNALGGTIPDMFRNGRKLQIIDLSENKLEGQIARSFEKCDSLQMLVSINSLSGEIPPSICDFPSLKILDFSFNNITGTIPKCLEKLTNSLLMLNLRRNSLRGTIPDTFVKGSKLQIIDLSENELEGQIPRSLENCASLEMLDLGNNHLEDTFPIWLGALSQLQVLILRSNKFHGSIGIPSKSNSKFPKLHIIDLSHNLFSRNLPYQYFQELPAMKKLESDLAYMETEIDVPLKDINWGIVFSYSMSLVTKGVTIEYQKINSIFIAVDLSSNKFGGKIPESIESVDGLQLLNLSNNEFFGVIPSSMAKLTQLESLDLSINKLSGKIPQELVHLNFLEYFNVSYNNLTGPIPQGGQFSTFQSISYIGNMALCGIPLSKKCGNSISSDVMIVSVESDFPGVVDWVVILSGVGSGLVIGLLFGDHLSTRFYKWFCKRFRK